MVWYGMVCYTMLCDVFVCIWCVMYCGDVMLCYFTLYQVFVCYFFGGIVWCVLLCYGELCNVTVWYTACCRKFKGLGGWLWRVFSSVLDTLGKPLLVELYRMFFFFCCFCVEFAVHWDKYCVWQWTVRCPDLTRAFGKGCTCCCITTDGIWWSCVVRYCCWRDPAFHTTPQSAFISWYHSWRYRNTISVYWDWCACITTSPQQYCWNHLCKTHGVSGDLEYTRHECRVVVYTL